MACSGRLVLVTRSVYGVMSYSRHTCPASLGNVPVPLVTLAMEVRSAADESGCKFPPANDDEDPEAPLPDARQPAPLPAVFGSKLVGGGDWASANPNPPAASTAMKIDT